MYICIYTYYPLYLSLYVLCMCVCVVVVGRPVPPPAWLPIVEMPAVYGLKSD